METTNEKTKEGLILGELKMGYYGKYIVIDGYNNVLHISDERESVEDAVQNAISNLSNDDVKSIYIYAIGKSAEYRLGDE